MTYIQDTMKNRLPYLYCLHAILTVPDQDTGLSGYSEIPDNIFASSDLIKIHENYVKEFRKYLPILRIYLLSLNNILNLTFDYATPELKDHISVIILSKFKSVYDIVSGDFKAYMKTGDETILNGIVETIYNRINDIILDCDKGLQPEIISVYSRYIHDFEKIGFLTDEYSDMEFINEHTNDILNNLCKLYNNKNLIYP